MTHPDRIAAIGTQIEQIETDLARLRQLLDLLPAGQLISFGSTLVDHEVRLDELVAHTHGGPRPKLTPGAQARIALDRQEDR